MSCIDNVRSYIWNDVLPELGQHTEQIRKYALISAFVFLILGISFVGNCLAINPEALFFSSYSTGQLLFWFAMFTNVILSLAIAYLAKNPNLAPHSRS